MFPGRSKFAQDEETEYREDTAGERGSDESNDIVSSRSGKDRDLSGDEETFVDEDEHTVPFLRIADDYNRQLD